MKIKIDFKVIDVKINDAVFKIQEMDYTELYLKHVTKGEVDDIAIIKDYISQSLTGWENLQNEDTGEPVPFTPENVEKLPFVIKNYIFKEVNLKSRLSEEEKKS
jgi:hypothetical protein